jgi:NAD(P)-dependent dehydrogenase (short-subunit alcohol dehydrogenase family)
MREDRFTQKVAFVTGAATGMGQQFALDLAAEGAIVVISDIDGSGLEETGALLKRAGAEYLALCCDVAKYEEVERAVAEAIGRFGRIDILINNAGILNSATIEETSLELIDDTLDVNVKGVLYCIKAVTPHMKAQGYGKIVNLASITGKNGDNSTTFAYGASKGAVRPNRSDTATPIRFSPTSRHSTRVTRFRAPGCRSAPALPGSRPAPVCG